MSDYRTIRVVLDVSIPAAVDPMRAGEDLFNWLCGGGDGVFPDDTVFSFDDWNVKTDEEPR